MIQPARAMPALSLAGPDGKRGPLTALQGQWLLLGVSDPVCGDACMRRLYLQRQLRETLGREKARVDKVWLIPDDAAPRPEVLQALAPGDSTTVLRTTTAGLAQWLTPASGRRLDEHLYLVDPMGQWMMRTPVDPDPAKLKKDIERLLRASASWDQPGR